jgi:uncharacterized RDD family membrane protein YckC
MSDRRTCPSCGYDNTARADTCAGCGHDLDESTAPVHPGETLRDPDDLTLPPSPLLRAVLSGEPDALAPPAAAPAPAVAPVAAAPAAATAAVAEAPAPPVRPVVVPAPPPITKRTFEHLSPNADQAIVLRDLAERLQTRKVEPTFRYAGFFIRLGAFLIDVAVLGLFAIPLTTAGYLGLRAGLLVLGQSQPIETDETTVTLFTAGWLAMAAVYFTLLHRSHGQTIGKSIFGLAVRTIDFREVGFVRCLVRTLGYALSSSFLGFGFLLVALTPRKRGWHDFLAGTCVVRLTREEGAS